jgi:patched 1 protein/patched 2 protein
MTYLGFEKVEHGLRLSDVTLTGSYQNTFAKVTEDRFPSYDIWIVTRDIDYVKHEKYLLEVYGALENTTWNPPQPGIIASSPLGNFYLWGRIAFNLTYPLATDNKTFYDFIKKWSAGPLGVASLPDLYCEDSVTKEQLSCLQDAHAPGYKPNPNFRLAATKAAMFAIHLGATTAPNLAMMKDTRSVVDGLNEKFGEDVAYMYGFPFLYFEQYLHSYRDLYTVVGLALVGVFIAVLVFQFSISISLIIACVLLMVDLEVYGFMYVIGAKLNSLSLVNLGIVVGMSSEFTYLARSFLVVDGTRNYRVGKALEWTLEPLLHGFGTQIAATIPLIFVKYHAFRLYYFAMFTIMGVLGFLNGFVLLPVILSWVGPPPLPHVTKTNVKGAGAPTSRYRASPQHAGDTPMMSHNGNTAP